jgi:hypothetical protein
MWPQVNANQGAGFFYHNSSRSIGDGENSLFRCDAFGFDVIFQSICHFSGDEEHLDPFSALG